jgi:conjugative transfer signal peptidase TraF
VDWLRRILSLWINLSPSLPLGVYRPTGAPVTRGAIVVVCLPLAIGRFARERGYLGYGPCPGNVERLGKRVAAVAGDTVETGAEGVRINGFLIPASRRLERDSRGRLLPVTARRTVVRPGELFLLATDNRRSFDSRYFGPVAVTDGIVVERLVPHRDRVGPLEHPPQPAHRERNLEGRYR